MLAQSMSCVSARQYDEIAAGMSGSRARKRVDESPRAFITLGALTVVAAELVLRLGVRDVEVERVLLQQRMRELRLALGLGSQDSPTAHRQLTRFAEPPHPVTLDRVNGEAVVKHYRDPGESILPKLQAESLRRDIGLVPDKGSRTRP